MSKSKSKSKSKSNPEREQLEKFLEEEIEQLLGARLEQFFEQLFKNRSEFGVINEKLQKAIREQLTKEPKKGKRKMVNKNVEFNVK